MTITCDTGRVKPPFHETIARLTAVSLTFITALAITRALYEGAFPHLPFLADPFPILLFSGVTAITSAFLWKRLAQEAQSAWMATAVFIPLLLNVIYLSETAVSPQRGNFLLFTSIWFTALLAAHLVQPNSPRWRDALFLLIYIIPIYLFTMGRTVGQADSFEFQVVIPQLEIAHPTGYPLYILLTKLFTLIPIGGMAWRVNMITAVYAIAALYLLYEFIRRLTGTPIVGVITAVLFALTPTFWSQAIVAEVYSLNTLIVITALYLMLRIGGWSMRSTAMVSTSSTAAIPSRRAEPSRRLSLSKAEAANPTILPIALAFVLGLGLTNHLTSIILLPPAILTLFFARKQYKFRLTDLLILLAAFLAPLLLYAYLPIRWQALHGEPMGAARFVDWVVAGRFRGALQLSAWLNDTARYTVVQRLFSAEYSFFYLGIGAIGFAVLAVKQWRAALALALILAGYTFYALNYYVPDLAVFLIPAHLVVAIGIGVAMAALLARPPAALTLALFTLLLLPLMARAGLATWPQVDHSHDDGLTRWGEAVLTLPLSENGAILADSEKIAPLYYLQRAEGIRPDLDIMVLPDEAAYRAELNARLAANQPVYLARYLPNLQSVYHLRAMGPLTAVSTTPLTALPADIDRISQSIGELHLVGYAINPESPIAADETDITLYWQADAPTDEPLHVYIRWEGDDPINPAGVHPVNNNYPTNAWRNGEIISDFHLLPRPISPIAQEATLQVAVAPAFTAATDLAWQTVTTVTIPPATDAPVAQQHRILFDETAVSGSTAPDQIRPSESIPLLLRGYGNPNVPITFAGRENEAVPTNWQAGDPFVTLLELQTDDVENGRYPIIIVAENATCGWMRTNMTSCTIGEVEISGVRLPANAVNYDDKIALLDVDLPDTLPPAGGQLPLTLHWQALSSLDEDYTVFIQLLDENDALVGQIDAWPLQGTYPTSQWQVGEIVDDPYVMQLNEGEIDGEYRLLIGYYLLADLRRLPVLDANGAAVDDKFTISLP